MYLVHAIESTIELKKSYQIEMKKNNENLKKEREVIMGKTQNKLKKNKTINNPNSSVRH